MRVVSLLCLCLLSVSYAGCLGEESPTPEDVSGLDGSPDADGGNETAGLNVTNTAPTANLTASVGNGTAPLNVTFSLDGSDADGDNLTWTFTVGNTTQNGTALPATVNVTLEAGNWTATLAVSDGRNETVSSVAVSVSPGGPAGPSGPVVDTSISWVGGPSACQIWFGDLEDLEYTRFDLPSGSVGRELVLEYKTTAPGIHTRVAFWNDDQISVHDENSSDLGGEIRVTVPEDATYIRVGTCGPSGPSSGTLVVA